MVGEPESGTIWWDLSGPGRLQPPREPPPPMSGKQCPADNVAGPARGWKRLDRSFPPFKKLIDDRLYTYIHTYIHTYIYIYLMVLLGITQKSNL